MKQIEDIADHVKTAVFRKHKDTNEIIALFPLVPSGEVSGECYVFNCEEPHKASQQFYNTKQIDDFVQYWGSIDYEYALTMTVPAIQSEYKVLHRFISTLGHTLIVVTHENLVPPNAPVIYEEAHLAPNTSFNF